MQIDSPVKSSEINSLHLIAYIEHGNMDTIASSLYATMQNHTGISCRIVIQWNKNTYILAVEVF